MACKEEEEFPEMSKLRIAVIYGGPSREHEVSIKTGEAMIQGLDSHKYEVLPVLISKSGDWQYEGKEHGSDASSVLDGLIDKVDVCLIGLHGTFGEDGQIQHLLELKSIPYSGSDSASSERSMKKHVASEIYRQAGMYTPQEVSVTEWDEKARERVRKSLTVPVVVKPESQGSSVGVSIVEDYQYLDDAVNKALEADSTVLIQQYIKGREVSCGVVEINDRLVALPPTEVMPIHSKFYDYDAKYVEGATREVTPPENMNESVIEQVKSNAVNAHKILGCSGYSRTDMIIEEDKIYIIETNTLPGMTVTSFLPQQVKAVGMPFAELLDHIIHAALKEKNNV